MLLTLAQNYGLKVGKFRIDQVRVQLLQLEKRSQAKSRHLFQLLFAILKIIARFYIISTHKPGKNWKKNIEVWQIDKNSLSTDSKKTELFFV